MGKDAKDTEVPGTASTSSQDSQVTAPDMFEFVLTAEDLVQTNPEKLSFLIDQKKWLHVVQGELKGFTALVEYVTKQAMVDGKLKALKIEQRGVVSPASTEGPLTISNDYGEILKELGRADSYAPLLGIVDAFNAEIKSILSQSEPPVFLTEKDKAQWKKMQKESKKLLIEGDEYRLYRGVLLINCFIKRCRAMGIEPNLANQILLSVLQGGDTMRSWMFGFPGEYCYRVFAATFIDMQGKIVSNNDSISKTIKITKMTDKKVVLQMKSDLYLNEATFVGTGKVSYPLGSVSAEVTFSTDAHPVVSGLRCQFHSKIDRGDQESLDVWTRVTETLGGMSNFSFAIPKYFPYLKTMIPVMQTGNGWYQQFVKDATSVQVSDTSARTLSGESAVAWACVQNTANLDKKDVETGRWQQARQLGAAIRNKRLMVNLFPEKGTGKTETEQYAMRMLFTGIAQNFTALATALAKLEESKPNHGRDREKIGEAALDMEKDIDRIFSRGWFNLGYPGGINYYKRLNGNDALIQLIVADIAVIATDKHTTTGERLPKYNPLVVDKILSCLLKLKMDENTRKIIEDEMVHLGLREPKSQESIAGSSVQQIDIGLMRAAAQLDSAEGAGVTRERSGSFSATSRAEAAARLAASLRPGQNHGGSVQTGPPSGHALVPDSGKVEKAVDVGTEPPIAVPT